MGHNSAVVLVLEGHNSAVVNNFVEHHGSFHLLPGSQMTVLIDYMLFGYFFDHAVSLAYHTELVVA